MNVSCWKHNPLGLLYYSLEDRSSGVQETSWKMNPKAKIMYLYMYHINEMYSTLICIRVHFNNGIKAL
jgi:hypothetical protein